MPWESQGEYELTSDWQFTAPAEAEIFRINHLEPETNYENFLRAVVAQGFNDTKVNIFNPQIFTFRPESEIFLFNFPFGIQQHSLCFKALPFKDFKWIIEAEFFTSLNADENFANFLLSRFGEIPDMSTIYSRCIHAILKPVSAVNSLSPGVVGTLVSENDNRAYLTVRTGPDNITLFADKNEQGEGVNVIAELKSGEVYDLPVNGGIYRGDVYALCDDTTKVSFTEFRS